MKRDADMKTLCGRPEWDSGDEAPGDVQGNRTGVEYAGQALLQLEQLEV
jgi:hypothetical protein